MFLAEIYKIMNKKSIIKIPFRQFSSVFFCFLFFNLQAESNEQKHLLRSSNTTFGLSTLNIMDNYLSPLPYSGVGLKSIMENARLLSPSCQNLSMKNRSELTLGSLVNPAGTAGMLFLGVNYARGMHYHFHPIENLQILAGGLWDIDFGVKYLARNVNNPVNLDMATNLNASFALIYDIPTPRRIVRLRAAFETPLIGCMFVPEQNSSYYEIFMLGAQGNFVHFSSLHNKQALRQMYSVEIPLRNSTWRFGFLATNLTYTANDMFFKRNDRTIFIGHTQVFSQFSRRNPAPENFIGF